MISLPDDVLMAQFIAYMIGTVLFNIVSDIVRLLDPNGREVRRKIGGDIISDGLQIYYSV